MRTYLLPPDKCPAWCKIADLLLKKLAVKLFQRLIPRVLQNPFLQSWRVNLNSRNLPTNLKQMIKTTYKYGARVLTTRIPKDVMLMMPYWFHVGFKDRLESCYGNIWGECQCQNHKITLVGQMLRHAKRLHLQTCSRRKNCKCRECKEDCTRGCNHPTQCRLNAVRKMNNIKPEWDPREPHCEHKERTQQERLPPMSEFYKCVPKSGVEPEHPLNMIRTFTSADKLPEGHTMFQPHGDADTDGESVVVYTDGSCHKNGTDSAQCRRGLWYVPEDDRNTAHRIGDLLSQTNNTNKLVAILLAIQKHRDTSRLYIASDSQYAIQAVTEQALRWLEEGFADVKNKDIMRPLVGEIISMRTVVYMRKVKGYSGDPGNNRADQEANKGGLKEAPDQTDISAGETLSGAGAAVRHLTQARAYALVKENTVTPQRKRTERQVDRALSAVEDMTGLRQKPETLLKSLRQHKKAVLTQKFSAFAWKALHKGHKVGAFWKHTIVAKNFTPCTQCNVPEESMGHIHPKPLDTHRPAVATHIPGPYTGDRDGGSRRRQRKATRRPHKAPQDTNIGISVPHLANTVQMEDRPRTGPPQETHT